ncbi:MAG: MFS transporter [Marmoricola sp.]
MNIRTRTSHHPSTNVNISHRPVDAAPHTATTADRPPQPPTNPHTQGDVMSTTEPDTQTHHGHGHGHGHGPSPSPSDGHGHGHGHDAAHQAEPHSAADDGPRRPWTVLALALTAQILVVLDISVVNTALPTIGRALHLASSDLQWMITAYLLMSGGGLLLGGRIADLLPRRRVFMTGMFVFTAASLVSGFAATAGELIVARGAQGVGAALMTPAALSLIMTTYTGAQRAKGLALWGAIGGLGIAAGVVVGGALTTWAGWQAIFWVNVPIGAVTLVLAAKVLPKVTSTPVSLAKFDVFGAATAVSGLGALMFALAGAPSHGWGSARTLVALGASSVLLVGFTFIERRVAQPLVHPHTWSLKSLVSGTVVMLGVTGLLVGAVFLTSIFVQTVLGYSAMQAGLAFLPLAVALVIGTHLAARASAHASARAVSVTGLLIATVGAGLLSRASAGDSYAAALLPGLVIIGFGAGMVFVAVSASAMTGIHAQHSGMASGFLMTGHEVGAALGVAVLSAVATTAGALTTLDGASAAVSRGFVAAAVWTLVVSAFALLRMPATRSTGGGHRHMH